MGPPEIIRPSSTHQAVRTAGACWLLTWAAALHAGNWIITPGLQVRENYSNNIALAVPGQERSDMVTEFSPSIHMDGQGGRFKGGLDSSCDFMAYAHGTNSNRTAVTLSSNGILEVVDKWFYLDGAASVSQQAVSPFGPQTTQAANTNANISRTATFSLEPHVKGIAMSNVTYELRYRVSQSTSTATATSNVQGISTRASNLTATLGWGGPAELFGWRADFSSSTVLNSGTLAENRDHIGRLYGYFNPDAHLSLFANAGKESGNVVSSSGSAVPTRGVGFLWKLDPRTTMSGEHDIRYFGADDRFAFSHRFRRSTFDINYSRARTSSNELLQKSAVNTNYQILSSALAATVPDPIQRDLAVRQMLAAQGLSPDAVPVIGFLSNSLMIQRALTLSYGILGLLNTMVVTAGTSNSQASTVASASTSTSDILASYTSVTQSNLAVTWAHRVSGYSNLSASLSQTRSQGTLTGGGDTSYRQFLANLMWTSQLNAHMLYSVALRRVNATGNASGLTAGPGGYREIGAVASLSYKY